MSISIRAFFTVISALALVTALVTVVWEQAIKTWLHEGVANAAAGFFHSSLRCGTHVSASRSIASWVL